MNKTLCDLLTKEQLKRVEEIIGQYKSDSLVLVKELRKYFATIAKQLEDQGMLPDYLAYSVSASVMAWDQQQIQRN